MKKQKALDVAISALKDMHGSKTGNEHQAEGVECDCQYGKAIRRLVRMVPKKKRPLLVVTK